MSSTRLPFLLKNSKAWVEIYDVAAGLDGSDQVLSDSVPCAKMQLD
jgi:hypothetical protein